MDGTYGIEHASAGEQNKVCAHALTELRQCRLHNALACARDLNWVHDCHIHGARQQTANTSPELDIARTRLKAPLQGVHTSTNGSRDKDEPKHALMANLQEQTGGKEGTHIPPAPVALEVCATGMPSMHCDHLVHQRN